MWLINKLKQKTDSQKKVISLAMAALITLVIVVVWISFSNVSINSQMASAGESRLSSISPWQMIKDEFSKAFSGTNNTSNQEVVGSGVNGTGSSSISNGLVPVEVIIEATSTASTTN